MDPLVLEILKFESQCIDYWHFLLHSLGRSGMVQGLQRSSRTRTRARPRPRTSTDTWRRSDLHEPTKRASSRIHSQLAKSASTLSNQLGAFRPRSWLRVCTANSRLMWNVFLIFGIVLCAQIYRWYTSEHQCELIQAEARRQWHNKQLGINGHSTSTKAKRKRYKRLCGLSYKVS